MSEKKFKVQKMSGPIMFWALKNIGQKEFGTKQNLRSKQILDLKKFWVQKNFGSQKMIGLKKNLP